MVIAILLGSAPTMAAGQDRTSGEELRSAGEDLLHIWGAPLHASAGDVAGLAAAGAAFSVALSADGAIQRWIDAHPRSLPLRLLEPFGERSPLNLLGRTFVITPAALGVWLVGQALDDDGLRAGGLGCAVTNLANTTSRATLSTLVGRLRPRYTADPHTFEGLAGTSWEMRSFPGGHAANIVSCASFLNHRFDLGLGGPLLYAVAAAVSLARTADGAHWTSDTVAGMTFGFAVGKAMAARSHGRAPAAPGVPLQPYFVWQISL